MAFPTNPTIGDTFTTGFKIYCVTAGSGTVCFS
jgi:hypothetical protein